MSEALDMSLDDLIMKSKKLAAGGNSRGRVRYSRSEPDRRNSNRSGNRTDLYSVEKAPESKWQHDLYSRNPMPMSSSNGRETKLYISNLHYDVSNEDIKMNGKAAKKTFACISLDGASDTGPRTQKRWDHPHTTTVHTFRNMPSPKIQTLTTCKGF